MIKSFSQTRFETRNGARVQWIDFLRGLAVLGMIEAHAVNSFLDPQFRSGPVFAGFSVINGLVAPVFLFLAGFLQGLALWKNGGAPRVTGARWRSLGLILLIGYGLQFPWNHWQFWRTEDGRAVQVALGRVDVLHCLAVTLGGLLLLAQGCGWLGSGNRGMARIDGMGRIDRRGRGLFDGVVAGLLAGVVLAAPFVWNLAAARGWMNPLAGYLSAGRGALFPLLPWSGFVLAGMLASRWRGRVGNLALLAVGTALAGWAGRFALEAGAGEWLRAQTYATRYDSFFFRLSLVLLAGAGCARWVSGEEPGRRMRAVRAVNWCGSRSLSLYVWHLVLLHSGLGLVRPLREMFARVQMPLATVGLYLVTLGGAVGLTWGWEMGMKIFTRRHGGTRSKAG